MDNFVEELFNSYSKKFYQFHHVKDLTQLELIAFCHGILYILIALNIDPEKINIKNSTLKNDIDEIINKFTSSNLKLSNEDKLNDFVYDKDNVGIRKYVPGRTE